MRLKNCIRKLTYLLLFIAIVKVQALAQNDPVPDCGCEALWKTEVAQEFTKDLLSVTQSSYPVWLDFAFGDGVIILNAGKTEAGKHCMGLFKKGEIIDYKCLDDTPKMLTQLYSYYLNYPLPRTTEIPTAFNTTTESPDFRAWVQSFEVETAVYMPVDFPNFPFKIPSMTKVQLAIHESFHIEVQLKKWYTGIGPWPEWDKQPQRNEVQNCYNDSEAVKSLIAEELLTLSNLIEVLLDENKTEACSIGNKFLSLRKSRYDALKDVQVTQYDGSAASCEVTEAIMEAEEGLADYASWTKLFEAGFVERPKLIQRYRAQQKDHFYLTGAMLMHAITLMRPSQADKIALEIVQSQTVEEGSLTHLFEKALAGFCN